MEIDHWDPQQMSDPFPMYERLREECPVARSERHGGFWFLTRYDDVRHAVRDFETYSSADGILLPLPDGYQRSLLQDHDPPLHDAVRRLLQPCFRQAVVQRWESSVEAIADQLIDDIADNGDTGVTDVVDAFTVPLPASVLFRHIADVSAEQIPTMVDAMKRIARHEGDYGEILGPVVQTIARRAAESPRDDVIGTLLSGEIDGQQLSQELVINTVAAIIGAGLSTTTDALSSALYRLATDDALRAQLVNGEVPFNTAVEEFLRVDTPVQALRRTVTSDHTLGGHQLASDDKVLLCFASANRDPERFADPETVDLHRQRNGHLAFGSGVHLCLGAPVARLTMRVGLARFLARLPEFRVAGGFQPEWHVGEGRGLDRLDLTFESAP